MQQLCRQYGCHPEAKGRVVDTACAVISPGQAKAPTHPHWHQHLPLHLRPHTRDAAQINGGAARSQPQRGTPREPGVFDGEEATKAHGQVDVPRESTLCPSRAPPATIPYYRRGKVYSGGGRERGGRFKSRQREDEIIGQRVQLRQHNGGVPPGPTSNARGASGRTWSRGRGGAAENPPIPSVSPGRADFGGTNGSNRSTSSDDSRTSNDSSDSSKDNDSEDFLALARRPSGGLEVFGELPALRSGRTRS